MKAVSWNVNGLRACLNKGFANVVQAMNADFFCVQETKLQAGQLDLTLPGYTSYWDYAEKRAMPAQPSSQKNHLSLCHTGSDRKNTVMKGVV